MTLLLLPMDRTGNLALAGILLLIVCVGFWLALFRNAE